MKSWKFVDSPIFYTTDVHKYMFTNFYHFLPIFYHFSTILTNFLTLCYFSSVKNGSISLFLSSDMQQCHHLLGCYATAVNSLIMSFLHAFRGLYLLHETIIEISIIDSRLSSLKLTLSRLQLLRYMVLRFKLSVKMLHYQNLY